MNTLVIGDSHGIFLARALGTVRRGIWDEALSAPLPVTGPDGERVAEFLLINPKTQIFTVSSGVRCVAEPHASVLAHHNRADTLCLVSLHGNDHNGRFMCRHAVPFDFVCPHVPDQIALGRQIIPRDVMLRQLAHSGGLVAEKLAALKRLLPRALLMFVMPPAPVSDVDHLHANPEAFDFSRAEIEDKWVRLKLHHAYADVLGEACRQQGVPMLPPPAAALDADGFLAQPHWQGATHAAPSYYELLMRQHPLTRAARQRHAPLQAVA